jgi:serine/threonine protein kinase
VERLAAYGEPVEGTPFGRYRLVELLGRGGMGEVWRGHDTAANNRTVAIKLPPQLAADHTFVQRFRREADAAAQLNNPHIIPIHNYGFPSTTTAKFDGRLYVDMRLVEGHDLQEVLADGRSRRRGRCASSSRWPRRCTPPMRLVYCTAMSNRLTSCSIATTSPT